MDMACASLAFIDGLGAPEMLLIFVIVLVLFGGQKLPEFARGLGKSIREFKKAAAGVEEEFKRALEEDERKHATPQIAPPAPVPALNADSDPAGPDSYHHQYDEYGNEIPPPAEPTPAATTPSVSPTVVEPTAPPTTVLPVTPSHPVALDAAATPPAPVVPPASIVPPAPVVPPSVPPAAPPAPETGASPKP